MTTKRKLCITLLFFGICGIAQADLRPEKIHVADMKKNNFYVRDGLFVGGDKAIDNVTVRDIRRAGNPQFERVVIDLEGTQMGETAAIPRPPYFQVAVNPEEKRLVVTVFGKLKLGFDAKRSAQMFAKSANFHSISFFPKLEGDSWTFSMNLKTGNPVEVFELTNPVRIIVDVKNVKSE